MSAFRDQILAQLPFQLFSKPKGFDNFYKGGKSKKDGKNAGKETVESEGDEEVKASNGEKQTQEKKQAAEEEEKQEDQKKRKKKKTHNQSPDINPLNILVIGAVSLVLVLSMSSSIESPGAGSPEITFQYFLAELLEADQVGNLVVHNKKRVEVIMKGKVTPSYFFNIESVFYFEKQLEDYQFDLGRDPTNFVPVRFKNETDLGSELLKMAPQLLMLGVWVFILYRVAGSSGMFGGGKSGGGGGGGGGISGMFNMGKSKATKIEPDQGTKVKFADVAGANEAKQEIMEFVKFLKSPDKFSRLGAKIPKGALLVGPPGTGKTLLAKATAGEASVPFYSISGSDFIEMFVGVGPSRVRDLFEEARKNSPCIIFIDEIDAVGRARSKGGFSGGNDERENTLNQLLVEMDGFKPSEGVVVLASTNRADILDKALLRPGRFDRQIQVDKPDIKGREQIFMVHLKGIKTEHDKDDIARRLAALTPGFSGADISNVCNEAALIAARNNKDQVELVDFEAANDRVIGGLEKKGQILSPEERKLVAYHEAGHAVVGWMLEFADPLLKVTIVPRGKGALGFAQYLPRELSLYQTEQLIDMICTALGGRAAEEVFFGRVSTGASDDLMRVSRIATGLVSHYGMNERLGHVNFSPDPNQQEFTKPYSEATARAIDEEVAKTVKECYERTISLIEQHKSKVEALALKLLEVETVNHDIIVSILGDRPHSTDAYRLFIEHSKLAAEELKEKEAKAAEQLKRKEEKAAESSAANEAGVSEADEEETVHEEREEKSNEHKEESQNEKKHEPDGTGKDEDSKKV
eukprot:CAMPEP_0175136846 /NCGR_PEP_ID=MMETSP0087-20121206/9496_1 /TAXON_ID=136419 /ORGANISM="Unknown Unknown, Strain D1" /LENGTH=806 /DNA_ID=CAMNT_0016419635 /DNA_START=173 /DNA_END=2593 /DNA_ORIENTATION=+